MNQISKILQMFRRDVRKFVGFQSNSIRRTLASTTVKDGNMDD